MQHLSMYFVEFMISDSHQKPLFKSENIHRSSEKHTYWPEKHANMNEHINY